MEEWPESCLTRRLSSKMCRISTKISETTYDLAAKAKEEEILEAYNIFLSIQLLSLGIFLSSILFWLYQAEWPLPSFSLFHLNHLLITSIFHEKDAKHKSHKIRRASSVRFDIKIIGKLLKSYKSVNVNNHPDVFIVRYYHVCDTWSNNQETTSYVKNQLFLGVNQKKKNTHNKKLKIYL